MPGEDGDIIYPKKTFLWSYRLDFIKGLVQRTFRIFKSLLTIIQKDDFEKIKFNWNGKHAADFIDSNIDFRNQVCEFVAMQIENVNLELIPTYT